MSERGEEGGIGGGDMRDREMRERGKEGGSEVGVRE